MQMEITDHVYEQIEKIYKIKPVNVSGTRADSYISSNVTLYFNTPITMVSCRALNKHRQKLHVFKKYRLISNKNILNKSGQGLTTQEVVGWNP